MSGKRATPAATRSRVLIVDDHPLVREGLAARICAQPDLEVCGEAADVEEALALIGSARPALLILDLALQGGSGLELIGKLGPDAGRPKVLVVSAYEEKLFAERARRAGAQGYLNKQELQGSVIEAIRAVLRGELYLSAEMMRRFAGRAPSGRSGPCGPDTLTSREMQVFEMIGRGGSTRSIAEALRLSVHTVESHRENIRLKLELRNGRQLVRQAVLWTLENRH